MNSLEHYYGRLFTSEQLTDALKKQAKALPAQDSCRVLALWQQGFLELPITNRSLVLSRMSGFWTKYKSAVLVLFPTKAISKRRCFGLEGSINPLSRKYIARHVESYRG